MSDPEHAAKIRPIIVKAAELLRLDRLHTPVAATYPLSAIKDAVAHVERGGKVLLDVGAKALAPDETPAGRLESPQPRETKEIMSTQT